MPYPGNLVGDAGGNNAGDFLKLLGNGKEFGLRHLDYTYQEGEGGIADALRLAEYFADGEPVCVVHGQSHFVTVAQAFGDQKIGAKILLKEVKDPQRFGLTVLAGTHVVTIEEKPKNPRSPYAVTGIYFYDSTVFKIIKTLKPSGRGELEITDVNNAYIRAGQLTWDVLEGWWTDAGTIESLFFANQLVAETGANKMES